MIAEPPSFNTPVFVPGKEAEIAALTDTLTETIRRSFAALSSERQSELLTEFAAHIRQTNAAIYAQTLNRINGANLLSVAGSLKDHPAWEDYERALRELREERRREAELLYPDDDEAEFAHPLAVSFGAFKDDPFWDEYEAALQKTKEEGR